MANITGKTELNEAPADGDKLYLVDVSDTTDNANGSDKHITAANLKSGLQAEPAEGAFVDGDKTKLDGIETAADVTDATNVQTALGSLNLTDLGTREATGLNSTGEAGGSKFLREDGDGTVSWQSIPGGGDLLAANNLSDVDTAATALSNIGGIGAATTDTLTNKTIDGDNNTISNIALGAEATGALTDLSDVDTDKSKTPADGDVLTFDGTDWNAEAAAGGGGGGQSTFDAIVAPSGGDYTTLGAAISAASAGWRIYIEEGTYTESAISTALANLTIIGKNRETVILDQTTNAITFSGNGLYMQNVGFSATTGTQSFSGDNQVLRSVKVYRTTNSSGNDFLVNGSNFLADNLYYETTATTGTPTGNRIRINKTNCKIVNSHLIINTRGTSANGSAIWVSANNSGLVNCYISSVSNVADGYGVRLSGSHDYIKGCEFTGFGSDPYVTYTSGAYAVISDNTIDSGKRAIYITSGSNHIANNYIRGLGTSSSTGVYIAGYADNAVVVGNSLVMSTSVTNGIYIEANTDNTVISGNRILTGVGVTVAASTCDKTVITGNSLAGCSTAITDSGTGTVNSGNAT